MRRMLAGLMIAAGACALAGCAAFAPPPPDDAEVQEWMQQQSDDAGANVGMMASSAGSAPASDEEGVTLAFESPTDVTSIEFSCFGDDEMSVTVSVLSGDQGGSTGIENLRCDESPHRLEKSIPTSDLDSISANASSTHGYGAWSVVLR
ncbi:hypothetical protein [Microbacterium sp. NPDC057650]|uniref:hypothetical protein n=1 Tax=unclassified Microbacterium TaxID=2609290 RepID=UPI00366F13B7